MIFDLSQGEIDEYLRYDDGKQWAALHSNKIFIFHSNSNGIPNDLEISTLKIFCNQGYNFLTCCPRTVKSQIGFGNFLFETHDHVTFNCMLSREKKLFVDCGYIDYTDYEKYVPFYNNRS